MARRIVDAGYPVTLWARRPATLEPFADTAAKVAGSPAELAAASDLVCLCVFGDADVEEVVAGVLAGSLPAAWSRCTAPSTRTRASGWPRRPPSGTFA